MGGAKRKQFEQGLVVRHLRVAQGKAKRMTADPVRRPDSPGIIVSNIHPVVMYRGLGWRWCIV